MILKPTITVSKRFDQPENLDRIKMDMVQTAAMEYFELHKNDIELVKDAKLSNAHQVVYTTTITMAQGEMDALGIMSDEQKRDLIREFRSKTIQVKGVGVEKADAVTQILIELLVIGK